MTTKNTRKPATKPKRKPRLTVGLAGHGLQKDGQIVMNGQLYRVVSVDDACSFTLRNVRWYDRLFWRLKRAWKWLTSFLLNGSDQPRPRG